MMGAQLDILFGLAATIVVLGAAIWCFFKRWTVTGFALAALGIGFGLPFVAALDRPHDPGLRGEIQMDVSLQSPMSCFDPSCRKI